MGNIIQGSQSLDADGEIVESIEDFSSVVDGHIVRELLENILLEMKKQTFLLSYAMDFEIDNEDVK